MVSIKAGSRLLAAFAAALLALPAPSRAAEVTRVASSFDPNNPFDLDLSVGFMRTQRRGKITKEQHYEGSIQDISELRYKQITQQLPIRLAIGLFKDFEIHASTSLVFNDDKSWWYAAGTDETTSTIANNCFQPNGAPTAPTCKDPSTTGAVPIFDGSGGSYRGGLGNFTLGLTWAPLSDKRDVSKPKWVLSFDYTIPTGKVDVPWEPTSESSRGGVGDGVQRLSFATALSKRLGQIDPYVKLHYSLPVSDSRAYSNCSNADALGHPENCFAAGTPWTARETGTQAPHVGGLLFGAEFFAYDEPSRHQQIAFDIQLGGSYVSEGRAYNELSDALGKVLYQEEYLSVGGSFGINARAAEYVQLKVSASLFHDTSHFLTNESIGQDLDGLCEGAPGSCVDLVTNPTEINPSFDFRYDMPGRRFRISETNIFTVMATGVVNF